MNLSGEEERPFAEAAFEPTKSFGRCRIESQGYGHLRETFGGSSSTNSTFSRDGASETS